MLLELQPYKVAVPERLICTVSIGKMALAKTVGTFECNAVQTQNLYHRVCYELRNGSLISSTTFLHHKV